MSTPLLKQFEADPIYGAVYALINRNYIGCWAEANDLFTNIRRPILVGNLRLLMQGRPTETNAARAKDILEELERLEYKTDTYKQASASVATWMAGAKPKAKKAKVVVNTFSALAEVSDEDE